MLMDRGDDCVLKADTQMTLIAKMLTQAAGRGMSMTGQAHADKLMLTMRAGQGDALICLYPSF